MVFSYSVLILLFLTGCSQETKDLGRRGNSHTVSFLELDPGVTQEPKGKHEATLIFLHGMNGYAQKQLGMMRDKGFFTSLGDNVRVVAPQIRTSDKNPERLWFPYRMHPWEFRTESVVTRKDIQETAQLVLQIIEKEAKRLNGDYSKIFIFGYSQGGMVAEWIGLMSDKSFGGIVSYLGMFPVLDIRRVSPAGENVPIAHFHDKDDTVVRIHLAEAGAKAAMAAGAKGYGGIRDSHVNGETHHGLSKGVLLQASRWIAEKINTY